MNGTKIIKEYAKMIKSHKGIRLLHKVWLGINGLVSAPLVVILLTLLHYFTRTTNFQNPFFAGFFVLSIIGPVMCFYIAAVCAKKILRYEHLEQVINVMLIISGSYTFNAVTSAVVYFISGAEIAYEISGYLVILILEMLIFIIAVYIINNLLYKSKGEKDFIAVITENVIEPIINMVLPNFSINLDEQPKKEFIVWKH